MAERKKLAVIDGKSVFYRGYYAMPNLSLKDGTPTGGVYGFSVLALELIKKLKPDYVAVAWDKPKTNIRKRLEIYPDYKAGRKPAPQIYVQIPILHDLLKTFSWPLYEIDDYEADDIMATLAKKAEKAGLETMLISSDLDMLQCLHENTSVYVLKKGFSNIELFNPAYFELKHGIRTDQFLDLKALKGDSSDNIPGVPGVGEKTAVDLLKQYETLDGIYDNLALVKDSVRKKLEAGKDSAYLSKRVALLMDDAPLDLDLKATDTRDLDVHALKALLQKLEFKSLLRQLPDYMQVSEADLRSPSAAATAAGGVREIIPTKVEIIDKDKQLDGLKIESVELVAHSRAAGKHGRDPQLLMLSPDNKLTYVLDLAKLSPKAVAKLFPQLLESPLIGYDVKSTLKVLLELGMEKLPMVSHDVLVGAFIINPLRREQSLTDLAFSDLGYEANLEDLPNDELIERAGEIASVLRDLAYNQSEQMSEVTKFIKLAAHIEWPIIPVLARMEYKGIKLDGPYLDKMSGRLEGLISDIEQTIYGFADHEFNISSPAQLSDVLFTKLNLPHDGVKKGKTGSYSTATDVLEKLRPLHPIVECIVQYREYTKLKNTYVDTLPKMVDKNSRLHTTFSLTVAQTGRLSSNDPNLQNIPVRTELGKQIRTAFVADKGNALVSADYSQFELRIAAAMSGEDSMIKAFNANRDIHTETAALIQGIKPEDVTKDQRYAAKAVNFGIMYGQGVYGLSAGTGITMEASKAFIDKYFEVRPKLKEMIERFRGEAKDRGYVETLFGRRRPTPDALSSNFIVRESAYRQAVNMPLQGTAADLMKMAMIKLDEEIMDGCRQLLQIHDSILVECPAGDAAKIAKLMKDTMENIYPELGVNLLVETSTGQNWGEL